MARLANRLLLISVLMNTITAPSNRQNRSYSIPPWNLFLTLFPDFYSRTQLAALTEWKRERHNLTGRPLAEHRYHISLHGWPFDQEPPKEFVERVSAAAHLAAGPVPPFEVWFNRTVSYLGSRAFVLHSQGGNSILKQFHAELGTALENYGAPCAPSFTPHVTLLYDERLVREETVEPVSWIANEFALVCRATGKAEYSILDRWKLRG